MILFFFFLQCDEKVEENIRYAFENIENDWDLIHQEGEMKVGE